MIRALALIAALAACKKSDSADCTRVADPVIAEMARLEQNAKDDQEREFRKKYAPVAAAAIAKSCRDNKWSAAAIAACSKELPLRPVMNHCDGALTPDQLAALRKDLGAEAITGVSLSQVMLDEAAKSAKQPPGPPEKPTCKTVAITIDKADSLVVKRDTESTVKPDALKATLEPLAKTCVGEVLITAADDVEYQTMITAMDLAKSAGFVDISLFVGSEPDPAAQPTRPASSDAVKDAPVVIVTKTDIEIALGSDKREKLGPIADVDAAKLEAAILKAKQTQGVLIVQADAKTRAKTINMIVATAKKNGFGDLLFAVKNR